MNYLRIFLIFFLLSMLPKKLYAQSNDFEAGLYNVAVGSILGGIGAVINKEPDEKFGKTLWEGMAQGALGGYLIFESKRLVREFARTGNYAYVWSSKLVNAAGASIIENAAANGEFLEKWHFNIGFNRIELTTSDELKIRYKIMPFAFVNTIIFFVKYQLNITKSIHMGTFVFKRDFISNDNYNFSVGGSTSANSIVITDENLLPHELIHIYQYENFSPVNQFFKKPIKHYSLKSNFFRRITNILYIDLNYPFSQVLYSLETLTADEYEDNFFEKEAFYYSR